MPSALRPCAARTQPHWWTVMGNHRAARPSSAASAMAAGGARVDGVHLAAEPMQMTRMMEGEIHAEGVGPLLRQGERLVDPLEGLVRIAQRPQDKRWKAETEHRGPPLPRLVEGHVLL